MKPVVFLGPSGVGKSYLYNKLNAINDKGRTYLTLKEATIKTARSLGVNKPLFSSNFLLQSLLKYDVFPSKNLGIAVRILNQHLQQLKIPEVFYKTSLDILLHYLEIEPDPLVKDKRISAFMKRVKHEYLLQKYLDKTECVVFDESALHHHHGLNSKVIASYPEKDLTNDGILCPAAVISCEAPLDVIFKRALQRRQHGINTFSHRGLSEIQLRNYISNNVEEYRLKIEFLKKTGIPVIQILTTQADTVNLPKVQSFIQSIILK